MKYVLLVMLFFVGCGKANSPIGGVAAVADVPTTVSAVCPELEVSLPPMATFMIPCPLMTSGFPDVLLKVGNNVSKITKVSVGTMYTNLAPGVHSTTDGRACTFTVNADGTITSN